MALQALFTLDLLGRWDRPPAAFLFDARRWPSSISFARKLLEGCHGQLEAVDLAIKAHAADWTVSRMNIVDRNILRIAVFELLFCNDIPLKVSINEAIEMAKLYGSGETGRFLNGILDKVARASDGS